MYSRNRRYRQSDSVSYTAVDEDEELYSYNLPPRYDGNRFSPCRREQKRSEEIPCEKACEEAESCEKNCTDSVAEADGKGTGDTLRRLLPSVGAEELLLISVILTVAGSDDGGELLLLLILLLIHG